MDWRGGGGAGTSPAGGPAPRSLLLRTVHLAPSLCNLAALSQLEALRLQKNSRTSKELLGLLPQLPALTLLELRGVETSPVEDETVEDEPLEDEDELSEAARCPHLRRLELRGESASLLDWVAPPPGVLAQLTSLDVARRWSPYAPLLPPGWCGLPALLQLHIDG